MEFIINDELPAVPEPEFARISMASNGFALVRAARLLPERRQTLKSLCSKQSFKWEINAFRGASWKLPKLVGALRDEGFFPLLEASVIYEMGRLANLGDSAAWIEPQVAAMEAATGHKLRPYQAEDVKWMATVGSGILGYEMRMGKSICALTQVRSAGAVVICPLGAIELVWGYHVREWLPWCKFTPLKVFRWPVPGEIVCLNYERLVDDPGPAPSQDLVIIIDEIQVCRNPNTARTRQARAVAAYALRAQGRVWGLTGTPAPNGRPKELWALLELIQVGKKLFGDQRTFAKEMTEDWDDSGARGRLASVVCRRLRAQVATQIPKVTWRDWGVSMNEVEGWAKEAMDRLWKLAVSKGLDVGDPAELVKALHRDPEFHEISRVRAALAAAKIPLAEQWVEEMEEAGEPCVVVSAHRAPVETLGNRIGWGMVIGGDTPARRQAVVEAFQRGELKGVAITVGAGGVAINLDCADNLLFIDRAWVPGDNAQAADRIIDTSEEAHPKFFVRMLLDHPLELRVEEVLSGKLEVISRTIDSLGAGGGSTEATRARQLMELAGPSAPPPDVDLSKFTDLPVFGVLPVAMGSRLAEPDGPPPFRIVASF